MFPNKANKQIFSFTFSFRYWFEGGKMQHKYEKDANVKLQVRGTYSHGTTVDCWSSSKHPSMGFTVDRDGNTTNKILARDVSSWLETYRLPPKIHYGETSHVHQSVFSIYTKFPSLEKWPNATHSCRNSTTHDMKVSNTGNGDISCMSINYTFKALNHFLNGRGAMIALFGGEA